MSSNPELKTKPTTALSLTRERFYNTLRAVSFFMGKDETRPHLYGALFVLDDLFTVVATDGHRLVAAKPDGVVHAGKKAQILLSARTIAALVKSTRCKVVAERDQKITLSTDGTDLRLSFDDQTLAVSGVDAAFPPWEQVTPAQRTRTKDPAVTVRLNPHYLAEAGKAIELFGGTAMKINPITGDRDPIRIDAQAAKCGGEITVVIMPKA